MRGVDTSGVAVEVGRAAGNDRDLADASVADLRRLLIAIMTRCNIPVAKQCRVMRCSKSSLFRDRGPPRTSAN